MNNTELRLRYRIFPSYVAEYGGKLLWLPFSPRLERIPESYNFVYYSLALFEIIGLILSLLSMFLLVTAFCKHQIVHFNLTVMLSVHGALYAFSILLRYLQIALETNVISSPSPACSPRPEIVIVRLMSYISVILLMGGILVERTLATYFVIDYEKKLRWWISLSLSLILIACSLFLASQIVHGGINGVYFGIILLAPIVISVLAFRFLLRFNENRLMRLNDMIERHWDTDEYSLSLRLQLDENIWTMQKLFRMALLSLPICLSCLPFLFLPPFFLRDEDNWWILELIIEANNAAIAAIAPVFLFLVCCVFEQVRELVLPGKFRKCSSRVVHCSEKNSVIDRDVMNDQIFMQMTDLFEKSYELKNR